MLLNALNTLAKTYHDKSLLTRWAFQVALLNRMEAYGAPTAAYCYMNEHRQGSLAVWVEGGWVAFDALSNPQTTPGNGRYLNSASLDGLFSAPSVYGMNTDELHQEIMRQQTRLGEYFLQCLAHVAKGGNSPLLQRLALMRDGGIDIASLYYHETEEKHVTAIMREGFRLDLPLARLRETHLPDGVFLKRHRQPLDLAHHPVQIPILLRQHTRATLENRGDFETLGSTLPAYQAALTEIDRVNDHYDEQCEKLLALPNTQDNRTEYDKVLHQWKHVLHPLAAQCRQIMTEHFSKQGQSVLDIQHDKGSHGRVVNTILALNPQDVLIGSQAYHPCPSLMLYPDWRPIIKKFDHAQAILDTPQPELTESQQLRLLSQHTGLPLSLIESMKQPQQDKTALITFAEAQVAPAALPDPAVMTTHLTQPVHATRRR